MKFTHLLKFNTVPEWRDHYIHYSALKKIIYAIAKAETDEQLHPHDEEYHELPGHDKVEATEEYLIKSLDKELADIIKFYMAKEAETLGKLEQLELEVHSLEQLNPAAMGAALGSLSALRANSMPAPELSDLSMMESNEVLRGSRVQFWRTGSTSIKPAARSLVQAGAKLKQRIVDLFVELHDLQNYLSYNKEGFRKILKKHDKVTSSNLKDRYMRIIDERYPTKKAELVERAIARLVDEYAVLYLHGDTAKAQDTLNRVLREQIKVERNTVWRDMVAMERKTVAAAVLKPGQAEPAAVPFWVKHYTVLAQLASIAVFVTLLWTEEIFPEPEKQNCLALLGFVSMLWATEAIPLYATSMLVAPLVVLLKVLVDRTHPDDPQRMPAQQAAPTIFHAMFSQTIMLLLGGFAIAAALSKHFIAKQLAIAVMSRVGRKPRNVLLAAMFVATLASLFISNVAAPVLTFSIVMPILKTLDTGSSFAKSLVMGIALASNIGGMTSPISSPQNIFAIERMSMDGAPPSWLSWFAVALPVSFVCNFVCWGLILAVYQPWRQITDIRPLKVNEDPWNKTQYYVIVVSVVTVILWCLNGFLLEYTGEMGVVAVLPLVAFFGFGVLNKDDFNGFLWNVVMLAMGGLALGEAVKSSGLLQSIAQGITEATHGLDQYQVLLVFCLLVLFCTTFISHTVGAMVILPIVQKVGEDMPGGHPKLLVMAAALMCSGAMGLPVSGFPNMQAVSLEDSMGQNYIETTDFLKVGVPGSVMAYCVIVTLGYSLMLLVRY